MAPRPFGFADLRIALAAGWRLMRATLGVSLAYGGLLTLIGAFILGGLLVWGFTPFIIVAAGAFLLVGPALLAGFFGIARAHEAGLQVGAGTTARGFANADPALWVIALVCLLLFMIFLTDAAILYSYMVGGAPQALTDLWPMPAGVASFLFWSMVSGLIIGFLLFCVSAFSVPLLSERRAPLVAAVVASTRAVFGSLLPAMGWAALLAMLVIGSILLLPLLPLTLPWLAYASHALYRRVFP